MLFSDWLPAGRTVFGAAVAATMGAALLTTIPVPNSALAAGCPSVSDPQGIKTTMPYQLDLADYEAQIGRKLTISENPLFADQVASGAVPPVAERIPPEDALVYLPYDDCGSYGGTLRGLSKALESGTSEILSWRQVNLVRLSDDLQTLVPNVAKSWQWNDDFTSLTMTLRKGHKWSDGTPFTSDDVVFYIEDLINNPDLFNSVPAVWTVGGEPIKITKIDDQSFRFDFAAPYPGLLHYLATGGSYFAAYAPKQHYKPYLPKYNPNADADAKAAGFEGWVQRFGLIWHKWKDAENITPHALTRPTLESHLLEVETNTQRRKYVANPYYFKVDTAGNQLPYIGRQHERFLDQELFILSILNGEVDQKAQTVGLSNFSVLKEGEVKGDYYIQMPPGGTGPPIVFNQTIKDLRMRAVYSDVRFRKAMSLAINRAELNDILWFDLGTPEQAIPLGVPFVTDADRNFMIAYDTAAANKLLDEMGMKRGSDGMRLHPDGEAFNILWEYSLQFAGSSEFTTLVREYWMAVGINVTLKEVTSQLTREKATNSTSDINMEWDVPFEPNLISQIDYYIPPYGDIGPLVGVQWREWVNTKGASGEEPPAWAQRLFELSEEWKTVLPGSDRYKKIGREMVRINLDNMVIIGTVGGLPGPTIVSNKLRNVTEWSVQNFNYGRTYPYRADQWYYAK
jgi:peptide/nickel transport system substrate-binding protein